MFRIFFAVLLLNISVISCKERDFSESQALASEHQREDFDTVVCTQPGVEDARWEWELSYILDGNNPLKFALKPNDKNVEAIVRVAVRYNKPVFRTIYLVDHDLKSKSYVFYHPQSGYVQKNAKLYKAWFNENWERTDLRSVECNMESSRDSR